ncbi:MAG: heavy metal translocating P-type ATPase [Pseudoramibacter sp.]
MSLQQKAAAPHPDHDHDHHDHDTCHHDCCCHHDHDHHDHDHEHEHHHHHDHEAAVSDVSALALTCSKCHKPFETCSCPPQESTTKLFSIQGLDCADCAAKVERGFGQIAGIESASVSYSAGVVQIKAKDPDRFLGALNTVADTLEPGCEVAARHAAPRHQEAEEEKGLGEWFFGESYSRIQLILGAILFAAGEVLEHLSFASSVWITFYLMSYAVIGLPIVAVAIRMLIRGQFFDEHFLMAVATLGAFAIGQWPEAVGVMLFYRIGEYFEDKASERSRSQIMDAVDLRPEVVNLLTEDGQTEVIPSENAKVGDRVLVHAGDRIPLDGTIVDGHSQIDTSPVTGEPVPVTAKPGDEVLSGCVNTSGTLTLRVDKPLSESMVTRILDAVENAAASKPKIDRFISRFAKYYTPFVVFVALATAILPPFIGGASWNKWIYTALSFLVISCPCALVLSVPLAYFSGIGAGSKLGILFKGGVALESMETLHNVVFDKTGTITEGNFTVQSVDAKGALTSEELLRLTASVEAHSNHPIGISIVQKAKHEGLKLAAASDIEEIAGQGISAQVDGKTVLAGNLKLMESHGIQNLPETDADAYGTPVYVAADGQFAGTLRIADTIKQEAKGAIAEIKQAGLGTVMLTGDTEANAKAVAAETGIDAVHAKLLPQDKLSALKSIRKDKGSVMFVGDGINDAPVLAGADVGAAMGSGADAAIEAADVVFMNSDLRAIPTALDIAGQTRRIAWANIIFALGVKAVVLILGLLGFANIWFAVFADTGVAMLCVLNSIRILYKKRALA